MKNKILFAVIAILLFLAIVFVIWWRFGPDSNTSNPVTNDPAASSQNQPQPTASAAAKRGFPVSFNPGLKVSKSDVSTGYVRDIRGDGEMTD